MERNILGEMPYIVMENASAEQIFHAQQESADLGSSGNDPCPWSLEGLDFTNTRFNEACDILTCLAAETSSTMSKETPFQSLVCDHLQASYALVSKSTYTQSTGAEPTQHDPENPVFMSYGRFSNDLCDILFAESSIDDVFGRVGCDESHGYAFVDVCDHRMSSSKPFLKPDRDVDAKMLEKNDAQDQHNVLFCCTIDDSSPRSTVDDDGRSKSSSNSSKEVCVPFDIPHNDNHSRNIVDDHEFLQRRTCSKQRAPTRRVAQMRLSELSTYFNMPINEASKQLNVGVTVLKRKCREFGVRRWPHRKIKSLDSLIRSIQDSAKASNQEGMVKDQAALIAKTLEEERNLIQSRPDMQLNSRIKRLRQASFKNTFWTRQKQQIMIRQTNKELTNGEKIG